MKGVLIRGGGVAALTCAHLLRRAGFQVSFEAAERPRLPAILLSQTAQHLIAGVFDRPGLFANLPPVRTRIVSWNNDAVALPHHAVVVSEADLLSRLSGPDQDASAPPDKPAWTIHTLTPAESESFGSRQASVYTADLVGDAEPFACWIESFAAGWLFLITTAPGRGWLLAVGDLGADPLACGSTLVATKIARLGDRAGQFSTAPRIATEICGPNWLACGSAAMAFDPLCGDGTAHAVREAILASAVVAAAVKGEDGPALCAHYRARLTAAFEKHLGLCLSFYGGVPGRPWWDAQCRAIAEGLSWCEQRRSERFEYRLNDFTLERVKIHSPEARSAY